MTGTLPFLEIDMRHGGAPPLPLPSYQRAPHQTPTGGGLQARPVDSSSGGPISGTLSGAS